MAAIITSVGSNIGASRVDSKRNGRNQRLDPGQSNDFAAWRQIPNSWRAGIKLAYQCFAKLGGAACARPESAIAFLCRTLALRTKISSEFELCVGLAKRRYPPGVIECAALLGSGVTTPSPLGRKGQHSRRSPALPLHPRRTTRRHASGAWRPHPRWRRLRTALRESP